MDKQTILQQCRVEGLVVKLPAQLDRAMYLEVKKSLEGIGGTWKGGKTAGFVFTADPAPLLKQIAKGVKVDIKQDYQFFATPSYLADDMVEWAEIEEYDNVLEPSAGQGAIIQAIHRAFPDTLVHYFELLDTNRMALEKLPNVKYLNDNFMTVRTPGMFHKIIANPPFKNNQDIDHVMKMYECLCPGGRIVTITGVHWTFASGKKESKFRDWLIEIDAIIRDVPEGVFKESGTNVRTKLLIINKPM